jgi:hypothetical protein
MDLSGSSYYHVYGGPGNFLVLDQGALQSDLPTGDDPVGRNTGVACVAAEIGLSALPPL